MISKPKDNYYIQLPNGKLIGCYIKNIEAAKQVIMDMNEPIKLIKIKRG